MPESYVNTYSQKTSKYTNKYTLSNNYRKPRSMIGRMQTFKSMPVTKKIMPKSHIDTYQQKTSKCKIKNFKSQWPKKHQKGGPLSLQAITGVKNIHDWYTCRRPGVKLQIA